jgi:hypothetical protein
MSDFKTQHSARWVIHAYNLSYAEKEIGGYPGEKCDTLSEK